MHGAACSTARSTPAKGGVQGLGMPPTACHPADRPAPPAGHECEAIPDHLDHAVI
jgi:hypothetical protein